MSEDRIRLAVLFGGRSGEHEVSCNSAASILANLDRRRYDVVPIKIGQNGCWTVGADNPGLFGQGTADVRAWMGTAFSDDGSVTSPVVSIARTVGKLRDVDLVFPALHGPYGEDGTVQALLEMIDAVFVGNGVLASALGMDKEFTKKILSDAGLAVAPGVVLRAGEDDVPPADRERLGLPVFVKPARAGSSLGVSRVDDWGDLPAALKEAWNSDEKVLVEAALPGREIDIGVLEHPGGALRVSPPLEILTAGTHTFFDYSAKYGDAETVLDVPATVDPVVTAALGEQAVRAFRALGCSGLLRVDFFVGDDGALIVNEVNTFPGFTSASQYPAMWRAADLGYPDLLDTLVDTALWHADL